MFEKFIKNRQLVDIVKTENGGYLDANINDFRKESFRISGKESMKDFIMNLANEHPGYKIGCNFDYFSDKVHINKSHFNDYIFNLNIIIDTIYSEHKSINNDYSRLLKKDDISEWFYTKTFQKIMKYDLNNSLDVKFLPQDILMNEGHTRISVIEPGMNDYGGYGSALVDIYELTKLFPRKSILPISTYMAKKIDSGIISRINNNIEFGSKKDFEKITEEGRYVKVNGFPSVITFDSELNLIDYDSNNFIKK